MSPVLTSEHILEWYCHWKLL